MTAEEKLDQEQKEKGAESESGEPVEQNADSREEVSSEQEIEELQNQLEKAKEDVLRAQAEAMNIRRRAEADVEKARKYALERFVGDLLPVVDNLERALAVVDAEDSAMKAVIEGIELTRKSFLDTLEKNQVKSINPEGEPFNPEEHQAMTMVPNPDVEPNTVLEVFQKGYSLNGRLIRPAMVVVSKSVE
ncbi:MAG: nucleotide exchange factor GrpE [Pseudomonadales bacterium]